MGNVRRQILAIGTTPFEYGAEFAQWPQHITLVPWFRDAVQAKVSDGLQAVSSASKPFKVQVGSKALFGASHDIPVQLVEESDELKELHAHAVSVVHDAKGELDYTYIGRRYRPHISELEGEEITMTQVVVGQIALIDHLGHGTKRVTEVFELHG